MPDHTTSDATTAEPLDWARAKDIFLDALELEPSQRHEHIVAACGTNSPLRAAVYRLLSSHESATDFLVETKDAAAPGSARPAVGGPPPKMPDAVGPYELIEKLGEGGHGTVYRARQHAPVEREVAIKVLKPGLESQDLIARFADERRFLARMDHPDIVKILDAGGTPDGRLFVVMELVRGVPLTDHADAQGMGVRERVALIARLARAVQHAHQRAVIHRDLKPTNILVARDADGDRLRIIDFGIARALAADGDEDGPRTLRAIGTPRYMSPEQAGAGGPVDTRTDIYAMGVILCELLTGKTPRPPATGERSKSGPIAATPPSRLVGEAPAPVRTSGNLRGDLDRIVLKCVAWTPDGRYASASELADDLERYLEGRPVRATPPGAWYIACKFTARHRVTVGLAAVAVVSLCVGLGLAVQGWAVALEQARLARSATVEARRESERAAFVTAFLLEDMLAAADPDAAPGREVTAAELLAAADRSAGERFADDRALLADIKGRIGVAYTRLGRNEDAVQALTEAIGLAGVLARSAGAAEENDPDPSAETVLGWEYERATATLMIPGRHKEAGSAFQDLAARTVAALGPEHPLSLRARLQASEYETDPATRIAETRAIEAATRRFGDIDETLRMRALRYYASVLGALGELDASADAFREAYGLSKKRLGEDHTQTIKLEYRLAESLINAGKIGEGEAMLRDTLERAHRVLGPAHGTLTGMQRLAVALFLRAGEPDEAIRLARAFADAAAVQYGADSIPHVSAGQELGRALLEAGRPEEALAELERILPLRIEQWGPVNAQTGYTLRAIADAYLALGQNELAETFATQAMGCLTASGQSLYLAGGTRVRALASLGRIEEAQAAIGGLQAQANAADADDGVLSVLEAIASELAALGVDSE